MKKFFMFLAASAIMVLSANIASAETDEQPVEAATTEQVEAAPAEQVEAAPAEQDGPEEVALHQALKTKFIEGGAGFMALIILCLIIGLALSIERILYLAFARTNTNKLLDKVEAALNEGGIAKAKEVCKNTRGPVASIFFESLEHYDEGLDVVEKYIVNFGSVEQNNLENGLSWISLFIAIAPSLGFLGTVIGMIEAFDDIQKAGDISPNIVAGGMKVALITTVGGLIVAMILQIFYNYILAKISSITTDMTEASTKFIGLVHKQTK